MKMKKLFCGMAAVILLVLLLPLSPAQASGPLDQIKNYTVTVDPRRDGTLDITYHIDWLVLDGTSEGPLTWVKVGIPNNHADSFKVLSDSILAISYLYESGTYVRLDLDRPYLTGETVSLDFSLHQSYMYRLDTEKNTCSYTFVPGWFDEIQVDALKILWNKADLLFSDSTGSEGNYVTWERSLAPGERCTTIIRYNSTVFNTSQDMQEQKGSSNAGMIFLIVFIIIIAVIVIAAIAGGRYGGGFGGGPGGGVIIVPGGGYARSRSCASSCACASCACACACAGGGRAGCSAKNFYGSTIQTKQLYEALAKKQQ